MTSATNSMIRNRNATIARMIRIALPSDIPLDLRRLRGRRASRRARAACRCSRSWRDASRRSPSSLASSMVTPRAEQRELFPSAPSAMPVTDGSAALESAPRLDRAGLDRRWTRTGCRGSARRSGMSTITKPRRRVPCCTGTAARAISWASPPVPRPRARPCRRTRRARAAATTECWSGARRRGSTRRRAPAVGAPVGGRHEDDRQRAVLLARRCSPFRCTRATVSAGAGRIPRDLARRRVGRQPGVVHHVVVAVAEQVGADVGRDHPRAEDEERDDQQRRDDADEDVGQDQLAAHPPQQPPLHQQEQPPHEIADRHDQPDRRGAAQHLDRARARPSRGARRRRRASAPAATTNRRPGQVLKQQIARRRR